MGMDNDGPHFYQARAACVVQENPELGRSLQAPIGAPPQLGPTVTVTSVEGHGRGSTPGAAASEAIRNMQLRLQAPMASRRELAEMIEMQAQEAARARGQEPVAENQDK